MLFALPKSALNKLQNRVLGRNHFSSGFRVLGLTKCVVLPEVSADECLLRIGSPEGVDKSFPQRSGYQKVQKLSCGRRTHTPCRV